MKRGKDTITLGSGKLYMTEFTDKMPTVAEICKKENLLGYIKGGASLEYTEETYEEKDDLGIVSKIITTTEEALLKCGLLTWNGNTLEYLIDRCKVVTQDGKRVAKIGGAGNTKGKYYVICFMHEDKVDGNLWVLIKGRNTAGVSLTFATDAGTVIEPEFKAMPHDEDGTLIELIEEVDAEEVTSYTVTYDANAGSGSMDAGTATAGTAFVLPECTMEAPEGKQFDTWAIGSADSEVKVEAGQSYTFTADTTVYAIWEDMI